MSTGMRPLVELCTRCIADSLLEEDAWIEGDEHAWLRSLPTEIREGLLLALRGRASPRLLYVAGCKALTDAVVDLAAASPTLTFLDLTFCDCADVSEALSRRLPDRVLVVDYYNEQYRAGEFHEGRRHSTALPATPWDLMRLPCNG